MIIFERKSFGHAEIHMPKNEAGKQYSNIFISDCDKNGRKSTNKLVVFLGDDSFEFDRDANDASIREIIDQIEETINRREWQPIQFEIMEMVSSILKMRNQNKSEPCNTM